MVRRMAPFKYPHHVSSIKQSHSLAVLPRTITTGIRHINKTLKGDIIGGMTAGLIPLPRAMALGALILAPLGIEYVALGLAAGLIALGLSNIAGSLYGGLPIMNNAPYSLSSFMLLAAVELAIIHFSGQGLSTDILAASVFAALFFTVFISGGVQVLFGIARLGSIVKYVPYPVLAGLLNGSAILIILTQIGPLLGFENRVSIADIVAQADKIQPLTFLVGVTVFLATRYGSKVTKAIPAPLLGILAGVIVYYVFQYAGGTGLGPLIGTIPSGLPTPEFADDFYMLLMTAETWPLVIDLMVLAFGIAAINSIRSLIVCSAGEAILMERAKPNRELIGVGMGNMLSGVFGGIGTAGSISSMTANHVYGGRTSLSRAVSGIFALLVLLFLHPVVALIPAVVLSGMLVFISLESIDKWSVTQIRQVPGSLKRRDKGPLINALTVLLVTVTLVFFGIFEALIVGLGVSLMTFLLRMSRSPVRKIFTGDVVHSNTQRSKHEFELLQKEGRVVMGLELQGALFFGTADELALLVENHIKDGAKIIILDFRRVIDIDCTGAKVIVQMMGKAKKSGATVLVSAIRTQDAAHTELVNLLGREMLRNMSFDAMPSALSVAENCLLSEVLGETRYAKPLGLAQMDSLSHVAEAELDLVKHYFEIKTYSQGEQIVKQADEGDSVFYISSGRAGVLVREGEQKIDVATLCPGTVFGEMSLLDERVRSSDVVARDDLQVYCFSRESLFEILHNQPNIAFKIISGLGMELATRIRISNHLAQNFHSN